MSQQIINISTPDDGLGDVLRNGFGKTNQNFTELYNGKVDKVAGKGLSKNDFTDADKLKLDGIEAVAQVNVQADFSQNDPFAMDFIKNRPEQLVSSIGYFHYNDSATATTPLSVLANVPKELTNDTLGEFTNRDQAPNGVSDVWFDGAFDFAPLAVGDMIDLRIDLQLTTTANNQKFAIYARVGETSSKEYDLIIASGQIKSIGTEKIFGYNGFSLDYQEHLSNITSLYIVTDGNASVVVNGWYVRILKKSANIVTVEGGVVPPPTPQLRTDKHVFFFTNPSLAASTSWYSQRYDVATGIYDSLWETGRYNGTTEVVNEARLLSHAITFNQKATKITIDFAWVSVTGTFRIIYFKPVNNGVSNFGIDNLIIHEFTIVNAGAFRKKLIEIPVDIKMEAGGNIACVVFNNNTTLIVKGMNITVDVIEVI